MSKDQLREELLKTLSFLEPMSLEFIFLDLDKNFLMQHPYLTTEDLVKELRSLKKQKLITQKKVDGQILWIKIYPKRPWYKKILR